MFNYFKELKRRFLNWLYKDIETTNKLQKKYLWLDTERTILVKK